MSLVSDDRLYELVQKTLNDIENNQDLLNSNEKKLKKKQRELNDYTKSLKGNITNIESNKISLLKNDIVKLNKKITNYKKTLADYSVNLGIPQDNLQNFNQEISRPDLEKYYGIDYETIAKKARSAVNNKDLQKAIEKELGTDYSIVKETLNKLETKKTLKELKKLNKPLQKELTRKYKDSFLSGLNYYKDFNPNEKIQKYETNFEGKIYLDDINYKPIRKRLDKARIKLLTEILKEPSLKDNYLVMQYKNKGDKEYKYYTINSRKLDEVTELISQIVIEQTGLTGSDYDYAFSLKNELEEVKFLLKPKNKYSNTFAYFDYINTSKFDLKKYQIYNEKQIKEVISQEHCLINSLEGELEESQMNLIKNELITRYVKNITLSDIADRFKVYLKVRLLDIKKNYEYYGTKGNKIIKLCIYKDHIFKDEPTKYKFKSLEHIKPTPRRYNRDDNIPSPYLIKTLFENDYFEVRPELLNRIKQTKKDEKYYLNGIKDEQKQYEKKVNLGENPDALIYYADFETFKDENQIHRPFALGVIGSFMNSVMIFRNRTDEEFQKNTAIYNMITFIEKTVLKNTTNTTLVKTINKKGEEKEKKQKKKIVIYFHNLRYDFNFIEGYLVGGKSIQKDSALYQYEWKNSKFIFNFRDSYKLISTKLSKFKEDYKLDIGKSEYINYDFYTRKTVQEEYCSIDDYYIPFTKSLEEYKPTDEEALKYLNNKDKKNTYKSYIHENENPILTKEEFTKHAEKYIKDNKFKHMKYLDDYLRCDVLTLKAGLEVFRKEMLDLINLDIFNVLTISGMANINAYNKGCFDEIYEVTGNLRSFTEAACQGGRCCTMLNEKHHIKETIIDFDASGLYNTAMVFMPGLPKGEAFLMEELDMTKPYFIIEILITKINKKQQIPFVCYKTKEGNKYTNEPQNETVIVDKTTLEDWIEFQQIEFKFIQGVYWEELNSNISECLEDLYYARQKYKREKRDVSQNLVKLLANSTYGGLSLKAAKRRFTYIPKDQTKYSCIVEDGVKKLIKIDNKKMQLDKYIAKNFNVIENYYELDNQYKVEEVVNSYNHFNRSHCAAAILSYSKRIMNRIMNLANDNNIHIYYQDTDSMHIKQSDQEKLVKAYKETYSKSLGLKYKNKCNQSTIDKYGDIVKRNYGEDLIGKHLGGFQHDLELCGQTCYSKELYVIGKKAYLDVIYNDDLKHGYHIRLKGVGSAVVLAYCKNNNIIPEQLYEKLYIGETIDFNLADAKPIFKQGKTNISSQTEFIRQVSFL